MYPRMIHPDPINVHAQEYATQSNRVAGYGVQSYTSNSLPISIY